MTIKNKLALFCAVALCMLPAAHAENTGYDQGRQIEPGTDYECDIANNGAMQTIRLQYIGVEDDRILQVVVFGSDGGVNLFDTELGSLDSGYLIDVDNDGKTEILISGRITAFDYETYCLQFSDEKGITNVPFADIDRGGDMEGYCDYGYGRLSITKDGIKLTGYQDILGTYEAARTFALVDGKMELNDDGLWRMDVNDETWEYQALTLIKPLKVTFDDGTEGTLEAGKMFAVTASDLTSNVYFVTPDGQKGSFKVKPNPVNGWGSVINGVDEADYFEYIPYAG